MNSELLSQLDKNIRNNTKEVELADALERLQRNKDFKAVILEGYLREEVIRVALLRADPNMQTDKAQASLLRDLDGMAALKSYFLTVNRRADMATKAIEADEATREVLLFDGEDE